MDCRCGLPMSKNPHKDAGKTETLASIGASYVCIPCSIAALNRSEQRRRNVLHDIRDLYNRSTIGQVQDELKVILDADAAR